MSEFPTSLNMTVVFDKSSKTDRFLTRFSGFTYKPR